MTDARSSKAARAELKAAKEELDNARAMLALANLEPAVRAVVTRLDLRTLAIVCALERLAVSEEPFKWFEEMWAELRTQADTIIERARVELASDPDVQTICQAAEIAGDCLDAIYVW
jgi:hypothetical protein